MDGGFTRFRLLEAANDAKPKPREVRSMMWVHTTFGSFCVTPPQMRAPRVRPPLPMNRGEP